MYAGTVPVMQPRDVMVEFYDRLPDLVHRAVDGLDASSLAARPGAPTANTIAWLVWHLTRVEDSHIAELLDEEQLWASGDWAASFGLDPDPSDTGYGDEPGDVARIQPASAEVLLRYFDAVHARTQEYLASLDTDALDDIVDRRWDPPVTRAARLVSIVDDCVQHAGQAAYARGLLG